MAEGFLDFGVLDQEDAGHLLDVACGNDSQMAVKDGEDHAKDGFTVKKLANGDAGQAKGFVELGLRVAEPGDIDEVVVLHEVVGFFFRAHVDEGQLRAARGDFITLGG